MAAYYDQFGTPELLARLGESEALHSQFSAAIQNGDCSPSIARAYANAGTTVEAILAVLAERRAIPSRRVRSEAARSACQSIVSEAQRGDL